MQTTPVPKRRSLAQIAFPYLLIAPTLVLVFLFTLLPAVNTVIDSLYSIPRNVREAPVFVGLDNYADLFDPAHFIGSNFVPVIGNIVSGVTLSLLAYPQKGWLGVGIFVGLTFVLHKVESYYLSPRLTARHVRVPGFVLIVSLIAFEHVFGFAGVFLSFPALFVASRIRAEFLEEDGILPPETVSPGRSLAPDIPVSVAASIVEPQVPSRVLSAALDTPSPIGTGARHVVEEDPPVTKPSGPSEVAKAVDVLPG